MIQGTFGTNDELLLTIELITDRGVELEIDAMLDTGFSEWVAIDKQDFEGFGWIYVTNEPMRTARGYAQFDIYVGKVRIDGQEFDIPIHVGDGLPETLIGRQWLKTQRLVVDMALGILTLGVS